MRVRSRMVVAALVAVLLVGSVPGAVTAATYEISSPSSIDTPDQTVTVDGDAFEVTESARVSQGEALAVEVDAPSDASYDVYLYDNERNIVDTRGMSGSDSASFSTSALDPGSYVAAVYVDGDFADVLPVVVKGYDVAADAPRSVEAGSDFTVSATLTEETSAPDPAFVQVTVTEVSSDTVVEQTRLFESGSAYARTLTLDDEGEYEVFVNVRGEETVNGENILLGFSDGSPLDVTASETSSGSGGTGGVSDETATTTTTSTATDTATETATDGSTATPEVSDTPSGTESTAGTDAATVTDESTATDESDALTPSSSSGTGTQTTDTALPVGALPLLFAALLAVGAVRRWQR